MSDPHSWGDYPSVADLDADEQANERARKVRDWLASIADDPDPFGVGEPTVEELQQEAVDAEDDRLADADWGTES